MRPRPWLVFGAVAVGLAAAVAIDVARAGGLDAWRAARAASGVPPGPPPYVALGHAVDVDGRDVYLDCRGSGSPTIILEAGFGASAGGWAWLLDDAAQTTRTCAWDRPGLGRSDARGLHTGLETAADLRAALLAAGERGPYVVVAHSLGGVYALLFDSLATSPDTDGVAAFVMIDTFEPLVWIADDPALDKAIRDNHRNVLAQTGSMIQGAEQLDWEPTLTELRALAASDIDTLLLVTEMHRKFGDQAQSAPSALAASWYRAVEQRYPNGRVEVVPDAGHLIHFDQPELVAARIQEVVTAVRTRAGG